MTNETHNISNHLHQLLSTSTQSSLNTPVHPLHHLTNAASNHIMIPNLLEIIKDNRILLNILISLLTITLFWLARYFTLRLVWKYSEDANVRYRWRKASSYITLGLIVIIISQIWIKQFNNLLTYLGLVSAGIAIAMKDMVANFLGWVFIISSKPFTVGDRVQIGTLSGDVIDIKAFFFTIMEIGNWVEADQSTGRIVHVPNGQVFTQNLANYTKAFSYIWNEIPVHITYQSDWEKARTILYEILEETVGAATRHAEKKIRDASKQFMIYYTTLAPVIYVTTDASGIILTMRYLCEAKQRRVTRNALWEQILLRFHNEKKIDFAYSTYTIHQDNSRPVSK